MKKNNSKMPYHKREKTKNELILKQKQGVNNCHSKNIINQKGNHLIVDSLFERSRKTLVRDGIQNKKIITIDNCAQIQDDLHHKTNFKEYAKKTRLKFNSAFIDIIQTPTKVLREVKPFFERKRLTNNSSVAITTCPRGITKQKFSRFDLELKKMAQRNNYQLIPMTVPNSIRLKVKSISSYNIQSHMSDNASTGKTGRTITLFYKCIYNLPHPKK